MRLPVCLAERAEDDLIEIWCHVAAQNEKAADRLLDGFHERWALLVAYPHSGPARDDLAPGLRAVVMGSYLAFYRVEGRTVTILRVLHGSRDITAEDIDGA